MMKNRRRHRVLDKIFDYPPLLIKPHVLLVRFLLLRLNFARQAMYRIELSRVHDRTRDSAARGTYFGEKFVVTILQLESSVDDAAQIGRDFQLWIVSRKDKGPLSR